jgi:hypothetical protein
MGSTSPISPMEFLNVKLKHLKEEKTRNIPKIHSSSSKDESSTDEDDVSVTTKKTVLREHTILFHLIMSV